MSESTTLWNIRNILSADIIDIYGKEASPSQQRRMKIHCLEQLSTLRHKGFIQEDSFEKLFGKVAIAALQPDAGFTITTGGYVDCGEYLPDSQATLEHRFGKIHLCFDGHVSILPADKQDGGTMLLGRKDTLKAIRSVLRLAQELKVPIEINAATVGDSCELDLSHQL